MLRHLVGLALVLCRPADGAAQSTAERAIAEGENKSAPARPVHLVIQAGFYAALGSPATWGPTLGVDLLPGSIAGRFGVRGEWRGYRGLDEGTALLGLLYEAGASRPRLALKLLAGLGLTHDNRPLASAGVDWSLWVLGPLGVSTISDVQIIADGWDTRPALSISLSLHLGR